tara:strand:+ start:30035 stop:30784 length:750 start_codon:yes stop_codon:yes gene_type:complete
MLQFLVKSKARRRLLTLLWVDEACGSVSALADEAGLAFATAHAELKEMRQFELVSVERKGRCDVYSANFAHPQGDVLKALLAGAKEVSDPLDLDADVKGWLKELGVPLRVSGETKPSPSLEEVLVEGLRLARKDPTVARSLPLGFWAQRDQFDVAKLQLLVKRPEEKHALGFYLDLTGKLGGDRSLRKSSKLFKDGRMTAEREFFLRASSMSRRKLSDSMTPKLARKWGFRMNLDYDAFESQFNKFASE